MSLETEQQNADVVQRNYAAVSRGDIPALLDLLTEDVEWTFQGPPVIPFAGTRHGREAVEEFFTRWGKPSSFSGSSLVTSSHKVTPWSS